MGLAMAYSPTLVQAVVVRDIGINLATLATFAGTVADIYCVSGHRCHFLSFYLIEVYHGGLTLY